MVNSVSQLVEPKIVNFEQSSTRQFQSTQLTEVIKRQNEARFESIDEVELSEFALNYTNLYDNDAADFSIEALENANITTQPRLDLVAFKIFKQADVAASDEKNELLDTDSKVTADELHRFIDRADFLLNKISILVPDSEVNLDQYVYFASTINDIYQDVLNGREDLNIKDFATVVRNRLDPNRAAEFEKVLDAVVDIIEGDEDRPVVFNAFI